MGAGRARARASPPFCGTLGNVAELSVPLSRDLVARVPRPGAGQRRIGRARRGYGGERIEEPKHGEGDDPYHDDPNAGDPTADAASYRPAFAGPVRQGRDSDRGRTCAPGGPASEEGPHSTKAQPRAGGVEP